ncbi:hypothetical protein BHE74_00037858, partial [Ensete ventricosum]
SSFFYKKSTGGRSETFRNATGQTYDPTKDSTPKREAIETSREGEGGGGHAMQQHQHQHHQRSTGGPNAAGLAQGPPRRRCEGTAMGAITLDLRPGFGIGPFNLGIPISLSKSCLTITLNPNCILVGANK